MAGTGFLQESSLFTRASTLAAGVPPCFVMRGKLISVGLHLVVGLIGFLIPFAFPTLEILPRKPAVVPIYLHLAPRPEPIDSGGGTLDEEPASQGTPPL